MTSIRVFGCVSVALALTTLAPTQQQLKDGESVHESSQPFPGAEPRGDDGEETDWCVRIVDAFDLQPVAGALVQVPWHPQDGVVDGDLHHQCVGIADEDGWARLPLPAIRDYRDYVFIDAPGYAATERCLPFSARCELQRGVDVPVEVVDYTGRPLPDARIELVLGCGHVPCQRTAISDAAGRATLIDIEPSRHEDLFVWSPACMFGAYRLRSTWHEGGPPVVIDVVPGMALRGRVLDANHRPVAGVRVGAKGAARPWARTDRSGQFELVGLLAWQELEYQPPPRCNLAGGSFTTPPAGVERTIVFGESTSDTAVVVRAHAANGEPADGVLVAATRDADGLTVTATSDDDGTATLSVPPGHYRLLADGRLGTWGRATGEFDVTADAPATTQIAVPRNPTVRVDASRVLDLTVGITTATDFRELYPDEIDGQDVPVPVGERATFRISCDDDELLVRFVEIPGPGAKVQLDGPPITRLRARFVGPDGEPVAAQLIVQRELDVWAFDPRSDPFATEATVETRLAGMVTWVATPEQREFAPRFGDVLLVDDVVDLGEIRFHEATVPELRIALPDDLQATRGRVQARLQRSNAIVQSDLEPDGTTNGFGAASEGDRLWVWIDDPEVLPYGFRVPGPPPWIVPWPSASLRLVVIDATGAPLQDGVVIFDGTVVPIDAESGASIRLRAIEPGVHSLVVAEREHLAKIFTLRFEHDETRELEVQLAARGQ